MDWFQWLVKTVLVGYENKETLSIAGTASVSGHFEVKGARGLTVQVPSAWTAADIGFSVSDDASTWIPAYDPYGKRCKITGVKTSSAGNYTIPPESWQIEPWRYARIDSLDAADETAENQAVTRSLVVRRLF